MGRDVVPRQTKRFRRLRLLVTTLAVTAVAVVGAAGTASATRPPSKPKGTLEICKVASKGQSFAGSVEFKIDRRPGTIKVIVGYCSLPIPLDPGDYTVTEVDRPGFMVEGVTAVPTNRLVSADPAARKAVVRVPAGHKDPTMLTFTNKLIPKGYLEICKEKVNEKDKLDGYADFTVKQGSTSQRVSVRVGKCSLPIQLNPGEATITEMANSGAELIGIEVEPEERERSQSVKDRTATVEIVAGGRSTQTIVTFINKKVRPKPTKGYVKICKRAGHGVKDGTPFSFTFAGEKIEVRAGECSSKKKVSFGRHTVTETAVPWTQVADIDVDPQQAHVSESLKNGTVTIDVQADDRVVTEVEFTNKATPPGTLKVCKVAGKGVVPGTPFRFSVGTEHRVTVPADHCLPLTLPAGKVDITEERTDGLRVTDIQVVGAGGLISANRDTGKAQVYVTSGQITEVLYTNSKPYKPGHGCVCHMKWFKKNPKKVKGLMPRGGLMVGGDRLAAVQARAILAEAAAGEDFRFEVEGELITALLNQLRRASTPTGVQTAIDATQLLLSQTGGALDDGDLNATPIEWSDTVTHEGQTFKAFQLVDTLGSFNEGQWQGGPGACDKHGKVKPKKKSKKDKRTRGYSRYAWPI